jgi:hypothetical protein
VRGCDDAVRELIQPVPVNGGSKAIRESFVNTTVGKAKRQKKRKLFDRTMLRTRNGLALVHSAGRMP